jgi:biopolymer transport protein ExbB/TolQ
MDLTAVTGIIGIVIYIALGLIAAWGAFSVIMVWRRVSQSRFRNEEEQDEFLDDLEKSLSENDLDGATELCDGDPRAMPQLAMLAVVNREMTVPKMRAMLTDRFQRDVLADLEYRLSWVYTVIKTAPMVGLLGTVMGMMGAFSKLATGDKVNPTMLADDISLALITTACGLAIAIPLVLCTASINARIRKLEDLVGIGLTRFLEFFRAIQSRLSPPAAEAREPAGAMESG